MSGKDPRQEALTKALTQIEKQYGKGSIMQLGTQERQDVPAIPTGSLALDIALGVGGVPRGRVVEIFGPEASGKTTLALHIVSNAQKAGGVATYIDAEHALDVYYARKLGVDVDNLLLAQPDYGEQALDIAEMLVRSNAVDAIVIDSVAALVPKTELEGEMGDLPVGMQARLMSQALRKLSSAIHRSNTCMIFINQIRERVGVMFGSPEVTPGGRALKFYASVRIDIRRIGSIKQGDATLGARTRATIVKNKVAPPFRKAEFDLLFDRGICREGDILDLGTQFGIVEKSGTWFSYSGKRLGQGRENARQFLSENPDISAEIENKIRHHAGLPSLMEKADSSTGPSSQ